MEYTLFVILTATLFLRPAEIVPALAGLPIYNYSILACLISTAPRIVTLLQPDQLRKRPITVCVLGILGAAAFSHLVRLDFWSTRTYTIGLAKVLVFYFIMVATLDTQKRLQTYLYWIVLFTVILSFLAVGHYHGYFQIAVLDAVREWSYDRETGERFAIYRLKATGIFNDPNDLSMIVVASMCICGMGLLDRFGGVKRYLWLLPMGALGYTLALTQSRGGLLALGVAGISLIYSRYGLFKTLLIGGPLLPIAGVLFGGRQSNISDALSGGTGNARVELWSEGLQALRTSPLFGIGFRQYTEYATQVAHNSYVHCLVELGVIGGAAFLGAFWVAVRVMWQLGRQRRLMTLVTRSPRLAFMHPFLIAIMVGYMVSMLSLSRSYVIPTYLILALITSYQNVAAEKGIHAGVSIDGREVIRILAISVGYIIATYIYIRIGFR